MDRLVFPKQVVFIRLIHIYGNNYETLYQIRDTVQMYRALVHVKKLRCDV